MPCAAEAVETMSCEMPRVVREYIKQIESGEPRVSDELTALAQLRSRYPATTIYNDAGAQMAARYVADTKNYVDQRIEQLTNAVVSMGANI